MGKVQDFKSFIGLLRRGFKYQLLLIFLSGFLNSFLQGVGIVLIIPLLEVYQSKGESTNKTASILYDLGWEGSLNTLLFLYFLILVGFAVFKGVNTYLSQKVISGFSNQQATSSIKSVLNARWDFFLKHSPSQIINLFNTEAKSVKLLAFSTFRLLQGALLLFIQLGLAFWISFEISSLTTGILIVLYIFQRNFIQKGFLVGKDRVQLNEKMQLFLNETFLSIKFLKLHKIASKKTGEYASRMDAVFQNELRKSKLDAISEVVFISVGAGVIIGIIYVGLTFNLVVVSELLVLLVLLSRVINQTQGVLKSLNQLMNQLPSFARFTEIIIRAKSLQEKTKSTEECQVVNESIEFQEVSFAYEDVFVLNQLNIKLEVGKVHLLFGESGKGKTTTLDLVAGLISPQSGSILIDGKEIEPGAKVDLSYVLQDTVLFEGSLLENICVGEHYEEKRVELVIEEAGLSELVDQLPNGLQTILTEGGSGLSGGEKQRISIARALIRDSKIILLDEFTSALDAQNETKILDTISKLKKNRIVLIVAHRERIKDWADEIIYF